MSSVYVTVYTKQYGKQEFTKKQWDSYDVDEVTLHRLDGPALERTNGYKYWYVNGKRHRLDGPAAEGINGYKAWYANGKLHRLDGPAIEYANGDKEWYLHGVEYTEEEFTAIINKYKQLPKSIKMSHKLWWVREL